MTNNSIIRKGVRALCAALLVSAICAASPLAAQAKGGGSHASMNITKTSDKASTTMAAAKGKTNTKQEKFFTYELHDAMITSVSTSGK